MFANIREAYRRWKWHRKWAKQIRQILLAGRCIR